MVSWNLSSRLVRRKGPSTLPDVSDSSSQQDTAQERSKPTMVHSRRERARRVQFDLSRSTVHHHYRLSDLSDEEFANMWITPEEFAESKKEIVAVVRKMMKCTGEFPETDDCCPRGLEFKTKEGARRRKKNKQRSYYAILEEQEIQRDEGIYDPDFLAEVYKEMAGPSSLEALNRGLKDQKAILELFDENERFTWEQEQAPQTGKTVPEVPMRRRSVSETSNGNEMLHVRPIVAA